MSASRATQVRQERKRRRREERRRRARETTGRAGLSARFGEEEWSQAVLFTRDGRPPDPARLAAFAALGTMSDALVRLMEPYVWWPPAPDELDDLEAWLELGAAVWNATVEASTGGGLREKLRAIVDDWDLADEADPVGLVEEIAMRKLRGFPNDLRRVAEVHVRAEGGRAIVEAATIAYLR